MFWKSFVFFHTALNVRGLLDRSESEYGLGVHKNMKYLQV